MRKLIVTAALMLAINTSPAYSKSDIDCDFVKVEALNGVQVYKEVTILMNDGATILSDKEMYQRWLDVVVPNTNMLTNVYNTFCK